MWTWDWRSGTEKSMGVGCWENFESDCVVREDEDENRYVKRSNTEGYAWVVMPEQKVPKTNRVAYGIPESMEVMNTLLGTTKERYDGFGVTWIWNRSGVEVQLPY